MQGFCENSQGLLRVGTFIRKPFHNEHSIPFMFKENNHVAFCHWSVWPVAGWSANKILKKDLRWTFSWRHRFHHNQYQRLAASLVLTGVRSVGGLVCIFVLNVSRLYALFFLRESPALHCSNQPCTISFNSPTRVISTRNPHIHFCWNALIQAVFMCLCFVYPFHAFAVSGSMW